MLVAVFLMAGAQHLQIWMRHTAARTHLWIALACLSACAAAALGPLFPGEPKASPAIQALAMLGALAWLATTAWFVVDYAAGDQRRRRGALLATVLLAVAGAGEIAWHTLDGLLHWPSLLVLVRAPGAAALAVALWLLIDGMVRSWAGGQKLKASVLLAQLASVFVGFLLVAPSHGWTRLPLAAMVAFVVVLLLLSHELARAIADAELASQRQSRELAHASRLSIVGELSASIAHEINQPLGAILNNADAGEILLEGSDPQLGELRKILADIRRDGMRASEVIRHVRRMVRKREMELERLDANVVVSDAITLLEAEARRRRMVVGSNLAPDPAPLRGDRALLEQVLINLILNAMDAIESLPAAELARSARNTILVAVSTTNHGEVELRISDAGPGLPAHRLAHLFDSFHTSKPHGMGLGLSISRSIVEAHGGRIRAENIAGEGAVFRITLPPFDASHG